MSDKERCPACCEDREKKLQEAIALLREIDSCGVTWSGRTYREVQISKALSEEIRKAIE